MLTIGSGHSAEYLLGEVGGASGDYYTGAVMGGEPPGRWYGKGAQTLGLDGVVDADVMHAVYDGFADPRTAGARLGAPPKQYRTPAEVLAARVQAYSDEHGRMPTPEQMQAWTIEAEKRSPKAVMFYDLTYSPPKSVTLAWAAYSRAAYEATNAGDTESAERMQSFADGIEAAVMRANEVMLDHIEAQVVSRTGRHTSSAARRGGRATGRWVDTEGLTVGRFLQHDSRDHDPQLHVHNAVLNRVECSDGTWRAIDGKSLYASKAGASAVASIELRETLTRDLGLRWRLREDGHEFDLADVTQDELDLISSRTRTLTKTAEELVAAFEEHHGRPANSWERQRLWKQATLATRQGKTRSGETQAEMLDRVDATMRTTVAGGLVRIAHRLDPDRRQAAWEDHAESWSLEAIVTQAVEACHREGGRATFTRSDLQRQIYLAAPARLGLDDGDGRRLLEQLTDYALTSGLVVQTAGIEVGSVPDEHRLGSGQANTIAPGGVRYAAVGQVAAEHALLRAAGTRDRCTLDRVDVAAWLDDDTDASRSALTAAQREAINGLASSDAALAALIGPAGTGKSYTVGRFSEAWEDLSDGGRVVGVASAQIAANILRDDGLVHTANTAAFLTAQTRLAVDRTREGDEEWQLGPKDVLVVDEANMVDTATLTRLHAAVDQARARMVLLGDPHQLGAVGAGGMMRTIVDDGAEVYTLGEVRRFDADWEREASLRLRDGNTDVVAEYYRYGRLIDAGTARTAVDEVARAAAADRLAGKETIVVAGSNDAAAEISAGIRRHLVDAGQVSDDQGVILGRDKCTAGVGDVVQARRIDRRLGLTNRENYTVREIQSDGSLVVESTRTGAQLTMPREYVDTRAALAYASTVHAAEGATVDAAHVLLTPGMSTNAAYVGLTRGRESNTAWVITDDGVPDNPNHTPRAVLAGIVEAGPDVGEWSATDVATDDEQHRASAATLLGLVEDHTRIICRARLDADLDQLVAEGVLSEEDRARFGSEQGSEHLSRQLRTLEQAREDPAAALREAIAAHSLDDAASVSLVVATRIDRRHGLPVPDLDAAEPARIAATDASYLAELRGLLNQRRADLGSVLAEQSEQEAAPAWVIGTLGCVPAAGADRDAWIGRAGRIAAYREATGWDSEEVAIGRCPGVRTPEKRAEWHAAYAAADMPEDRRPEAEMTDGRLRVRAAAANNVLANAPAFVDEPMRTRHQAAARAGREATLASSRGDDDAADEYSADAEQHAEAAGWLVEISAERGAYLAYHAETLTAGEAALDELTRRGLTPGKEPDRTKAVEWLADQRAAQSDEERYRDVTDIGIAEDGNSAVEAEDETANSSTAADRSDDAARYEDRDEGRDSGQDLSRSTLSAAASAAEIAAAARRAAAAADELADKASQEPPARDEDWDRYDHADAGSSDHADCSTDRNHDRSDRMDRASANDDALERS
jgi:conjugative relaxase-like TrwC/TraI family protein